MIDFLDLKTYTTLKYQQLIPPDLEQIAFLH